MAKIFISHAHEDREAAHQITIALTKEGLQPWLDAQELHSGDELLRTIAGVLAEVDYFGIVLTSRALTKPWVLTEMRMALTSEIERGRPKVIVLLLQDCELPIELSHKLYLDFRGRFQEALAELGDHIKGITRTVLTPKQAVIADMIRNANGELWARLCAGTDSRDEWKQTEVANVIRGLRSDELEAAVAIGWKWSGQSYKEWEDNLERTIQQAIGASHGGALRILKTLADNGFLEEAKDLDYSRMSEQAWCDGSLLWILRRSARRSGLFAGLPPPLPERLSSLLAYERPIYVMGEGWYAVHFAHLELTALDAHESAIVAVSRLKPAHTWIFRSSDDRNPLEAERYFTPTDITPANPFSSFQGDAQEAQSFGFDVSMFDDVGLLHS